MPLIPHHPTGSISHITPLRYHAAPVPSQRTINARWDHLTSSLTKRQKEELAETLSLLSRLLHT